MNLNIAIPYEDLTKLQKDSADKAAVSALLVAEFPDDTCQIKAIKAVLGITDAVAEEETGADDTPQQTEPGETTE